MNQSQIAPSAGPAAKLSALTAQRNNAQIAAPKTSLSDWQKTAESVARNFSTEEFAAQLKVKPQTIRAGYCRDGHYLGVVPIKLPNRRLLWDSAEVEALIAGRPVKTPDAADLDKHFERKAAESAKRPAHIVRNAEAKRLAAVTAGEVA
jgi:hypothetical protein